VLTYVGWEARRVDVPDRMIEPAAGMFYAAARGYSASLVAFDLETGKALGCVDVVKLGFTSARAWLEQNEKS
jgi:hypothetical protein